MFGDSIGVALPQRSVATESCYHRVLPQMRYREAKGAALPQSCATAKQKSGATLPQTRVTAEQPKAALPQNRVAAESCYRKAEV